MVIEKFKLQPIARLISNVTSLMRTPRRLLWASRPEVLRDVYRTEYYSEYLEYFLSQRESLDFGTSFRIIRSHVVRTLSPQLHIHLLAISHRIKLGVPLSSGSVKVVLGIRALKESWYLNNTAFAFQLLGLDISHPVLHSMVMAPTNVLETYNNGNSCLLVNYNDLLYTPSCVYFDESAFSSSG